MKIYYQDEELRHIQVDREKLKTFLHEQGMSPEDINRLCIRFQRLYHKDDTEFPAERLYGLYNNSASAYVFTHKEATAARLNNTLLHEIRHFMKKGYQPGESKLPYRERPSEVDAREFAERYGKQYQFITVVSSPTLPQTPTVAPAPTAPASTGFVPVLAALGALFLAAQLLRGLDRRQGGRA
jgi:hypothetical protein